MNVVNVQEKYKYALDRAHFEHDRAAGNIAFMLSKHIDDSNDDFLQSDLYKRLNKRAEEATLNSKLLTEITIQKIFEDANIQNKPLKYTLKDENWLLVY